MARARKTRLTDAGIARLKPAASEYTEPLAKSARRAGFSPDLRLLRWDRPTLVSIMVVTKHRMMPTEE